MEFLNENNEFNLFEEIEEEIEERNEELNDNNFNNLNEENSIEKIKLTKTEKRKEKLKKKKEKLENKIKLNKIKKRELFLNLSEEERNNLKLKRKEENKLKVLNLQKSLNSNISVCIDLNFNSEFNNERELRSLAVQIRLSYIELKHSENPVSLHLTSLQDGIVKNILTSQGYENWFIKTHEEPVEELFPCSDLIYLSPDAEEPLTHLEPNKMYVIGGIVDRNIKQSVTLNKANYFEIPCYRLPIREYFPSCQKTVINIDQVVRALCIFNSTQNWETSITQSVPQRRRG